MRQLLGDIAFGSFATYASVTSTSSDPTIDHIAFTFDPIPGLGDLVTLKVFAQGHNFWFFVNGIYLGEETHNGTMQGAVGFALYNFNPTGRESLEFKDLTTRSLQNGSAGSPEPTSATYSAFDNVEWLPALAHELQPTN